MVCGGLLSQCRLEVGEADNTLFSPGFLAVLEHHKGGQHLFQVIARRFPECRSDHSGFTTSRIGEAARSDGATIFSSSGSRSTEPNLASINWRTDGCWRL